MELIFKLALVAVAAWVIWRCLQPRSVFEVRVNAGTAKAVYGTVTLAFLGEIREVCTRHQVPSGAVRGILNGSRVSLRFSPTIPPAGQQQLRNWWAMSGWSG